MTDSATSRYKARQQSQGSNTNTWGDDKLNEVLRLLDRGSKGYQSLAMTGDTTLSWTNFVATNDGQCAVLKLTGTLSSAANLVVPSAEWVWDIVWNTTGQTITMKTSAGTGVSIPNGRKAKVFCDASDCYLAVPNVMDSITLTNSRDVVDKANLDTTVAAAAVPGAAGTVKVDAAATSAYLGAALTDSGAATITDNGDTLDVGVPFTGLIRASTQTTLFTASDNTHYPVDLSSAIAVTLAASSVGAVIEFTPFGTNTLSVTPSSTLINGSSAVRTYTESAGTLRAVYVSSARGWNMPIQTGGGVHFSEAWELLPHTSAASDYSISDKAGSLTDSSAVAFFTELALRGATETNNLTADTWITVANLSGKGLFAGVIGPISAGADTTTFGINVDGTGEVEYPILNSAGQRASMLASYLQNSAFTSAPDFADSGGDLNAAKTIIGDGASSRFLPAWDTISFFGTPCLKFKTSLVVRVKHSQNVTNVVASAHKGSMHRMGLA